MSEKLDNHRINIYYYYGAAATRSGIGLTNNRPFINTNSTIANGLGGFDTQISYAARQNGNVVNSAIQERISRYVDVSNNACVNNTVPTILSVNNIQNEFKPYCQVVNTYYMDIMIILLLN
jgi:hypothetical protein